MAELHGDVLVELTSRLAVAMSRWGQARESAVREIVGGCDTAAQIFDAQNRMVASSFDTCDVLGPVQHRPAWADRRDARLRVADTVEALVGRSAYWVGFNARFVERRSFERCLVGSPNGPLPDLAPDFGMNCWEILLYAAIRTGELGPADIARLYPAPRGADGRVVPAWFDEYAAALTPGGASTLEAGIPDESRLRRGHLVIWDAGGFPMEHVAMLTGNSREICGRRSPEIYSFVNTNDSGVMTPGTAQVVTTTIDDVTPIVSATCGAVTDIRVGRGCW